MSPLFLEGRIDVLIGSKMDRALLRTFEEKDYTELTICGMYGGRVFVSSRQILPSGVVVYTFISLESE